MPQAFVRPFNTCFEDFFFIGFSSVTDAFVVSKRSFTSFFLVVAQYSALCNGLISMHGRNHLVTPSKLMSHRS